MLHLIEYFTVCHSRSLDMVTIPSIAYEFLFVFHCNYGHFVLFSKLVQKQLGYRQTINFSTLVEKRQFFIPLLFILHDDI